MSVSVTCPHVFLIPSCVLVLCAVPSSCRVLRPTRAARATDTLALHCLQSSSPKTAVRAPSCLRPLSSHWISRSRIHCCIHPQQPDPPLIHGIEEQPPPTTPSVACSSLYTPPRAARWYPCRLDMSVSPEPMTDPAGRANRNTGCKTCGKRFSLITHRKVRGWDRV